jgi:hypothetical protein
MFETALQEIFERGSFTNAVAYVASLFDCRRLRRVHGISQFGLLSVSHRPAFDARLGL